MPNDLPERIIGAASFVQRQSLCLPGTTPDEAIHSGDPEFANGLVQTFNASENNMTEELVLLKAELREADTETFWKRLMQGMTKLTNAQYGFVAKRILVNDEDSAVEMPKLGEEGSCLMGVAFYLNEETGEEKMFRDYKYVAWGAPCGHMRHDKVFLIPNNMSRFILNNPNKFPVQPEAYIGIPLFSDGKCFAHFGMMWTQEALDNRKVSWGYMEMLLHALEDMIADRILQSGSALRDAATKESKRALSMPQEVQTSNGITTMESIYNKVISANLVGQDQSLKPYAKSLSHELRTPMQGVVGMLDVMHATVEDALAAQSDSRFTNVFSALKENIEIIQDSSKRAVEAADNVVHAYDLNMQIPDTPMDWDGVATSLGHPSDRINQRRPRFLIEGSDIPVNPFKRRRRSTPSELSQGSGHPRTKLLKHTSDTSPRTEGLRSAVAESNKIVQATPSKQSNETVFNAVTNTSTSRPTITSRSTTSRIPTSANSDTDGTALLASSKIRQTNLRDLINVVIHESLHVGGRPESAVGVPTSFGEKVEVKVKHSSGTLSTNHIEVTIDPAVPETLMTDERDLAKLISCVFLNAMKFTDGGQIDVIATLSPAGKYVVITVRDTGKGIPEDFLPNIFKPFAREDNSITRSQEGLGLGLLVAKGLSRKIGGDLVCLRSSTSGPKKGSEFAISIPLIPVTPAASPTVSSIDRTPSPGPMNEVEPMDRASTLRQKTHQLQIASRESSTSPSRTLMTVQGESKENSLDVPAPPPQTRKGSAGSNRGPKKPANFDRELSKKYPLTFLVAEDNRINRRLLVNMLNKLGYQDVYEAFDGKEAVRVVNEILDSTTNPSANGRRRSDDDQDKPLKPVDMILMDLWMPEMDGYEATQRIREIYLSQKPSVPGNPLTVPTVLAVSADVTNEAMSRAARVGMEGFMTKPYKIPDLQRLIVEYCGRGLGED